MTAAVAVHMSRDMPNVHCCRHCESELSSKLPIYTLASSLHDNLEAAYASPLVCSQCLSGEGR
jgi:hypothetical protein